MADTGDQFDWKHLLGIVDSSFRSSPRNLGNFRERDNSPVEDMLGSSQLLDLSRQRLPENVGSTKAGQWALDQLPRDENPESFVEKLRRGVQGIPTGGYSKEYMQNLAGARQEDQKLRMNTVLKGSVPNRANTADIPVGDKFSAAAAQATGVAAADLATDGLRNIWWFLNAPQALASIAVLQAVHGGGADSKPVGETGPLLKSRGLRLAATVPAIIGMSYGIGNATRQPGYGAVIPSENDRTISADPLAEAGSRYFLGRTGALMPYDDFVKERPDVSRGEYESYKAYLFGNRMPVKATLEGIHGPEVNFLGKSIPLATGVLPAVAAVLGARYGVNKAAARLKEKGLLEKAQSAEGRWIDAKEQYGDKSRQEQRAYQVSKKRLDANEGEILKQALLYSGGSMTAAALAGQTLESLRRTIKGPAPLEPEEVLL